MSKPVVIVGAGVVGLSVAWHCLRRGFSVTVVERDSDDERGCSYGNAGLVVPSHFVPLAAPGVIGQALRWMFQRDAPLRVPPRLSWNLLRWSGRFLRAATSARVERAAPLLRDLLLAGREEIETLATEWNGDFGYERTGLLMLCRTRECLEEESRLADTASRLGIPAEVLDRDGVARRDPNVRMEVCGGVWFPYDGRLDPRRLMRSLRERVTEAGGVMVQGAETIGFDVEHQRLRAVRTTAGEVAADEFVLACGAWTGVVAARLGVRVPMEAGNGYSLTLENPPAMPTVPSICVEARVAVTPMGDALRFGGTMELAGLRSPPRPERARAIARAACRYFPDFREEHFAAVEPWMGRRPLSPDGLPYLGRTRKYDNLTIAAGHAMLGVSLGPITGRIVAQLLSNERPPFDLTLVDPDRYDIMSSQTRKEDA